MEAVRVYLADGPGPADAFDALYSCFGDHAGKLAAFDSIHDRPADTRHLRADLRDAWETARARMTQSVSAGFQLRGQRSERDNRTRPASHDDRRP